MIELNQKHIDYLDSQFTGEKMMFGTPIYKSVKACVLASLVGYKGNFRSVYIRNDNNIMVFVSGDLLPLQIR